MAKVQTSVAIGALSGSLGNISFRTTATGTQMVERQRPRDPRTAAQRETRERMAQVARTWKSMSLEQAAAWRAYAQSLAGALAPTPVPFNVFAALAMRALAVNPSAPIPLVPPSAPFSGDAVSAELGAGPGEVVLQVLQGNAPGVVTEVLVQKLASVHRAAYAEKYRSKGFSAWVSGGVVRVPAKPGVYAVAVRTVRAATGQSSALMPLGRVVVGR